MNTKLHAVVDAVALDQYFHDCRRSAIIAARQPFWSLVTRLVAARRPGRVAELNGRNPVNDVEHALDFGWQARFRRKERI